MASQSLDPSLVRARMERMYRPQRLIYDLTRKPYLLGRDRLLDGIVAPPGARILEIGFGTGRNLRRLGRRLPGVLLCGVEPARSMLELAARRLRRDGFADRARLAWCTAETLDPLRQFGVEAFDHVIASYCLSMIGDPLPALDRALAVLAPGGTFHLVDFGAMEGLPSPAARAIRAWLECFAVRHRPEVGAELARRAAAGAGRLETAALAGGYAELARFTVTGPVGR